MTLPGETCTAQDAGEQRVEQFRKALGPFVVAAETTRMPMIFTDAQIGRHPVVFANDSFLALTGFDRAAILGEGIAFLLAEVTDRGTLSSIETALGTGVDSTWQAQCRRRDGGEYLATVFLSPVRDADGVIRQHFVCFVKVDGHVERLLDERNEFHALYERAPGFIATSEGPGHRFTFANASYRRLVGREKLIGHRVAKALPEIANQGFIAILDEVFQTGKPYVGTSMPIEFLEADGHGTVLRYIDFIYQPVRDSSDRITGLFCEGYDVTAARLAADQLSLLESEVAHLSRVNAMGMMAATLAHELNQPLAAISSYAAGGLRVLNPPQQDIGAIGEALQAIEEAAQRAGDIIRHVRELTRRGETSKGRFAVKAAIAECVRLVRAGGCSDVVIDDLTTDGLTMVADRIQIQQVVINLLRNACDAARESGEGRVIVGALTQRDGIVISVTDSGPGISAEDAKRIFTWTNSSKEGGTGLGLSISRTIAEAHHGRLWLERSDPSGSKFSLWVPVGAARNGGDAGG